MHEQWEYHLGAGQNVQLFSCKYVPWGVDSEIIIPSCILLESWSEANRSDNFPFPVFVSEMETR